MTTVNVNLMARVKAVAVNVRSTKVMINRMSKRDTLEVAQGKVKAKLQANKDYFTGATTEQVDAVYKKQPDGTYTVGIKYGNRYLDALFDGKAFIEGVAENEVAALLDVFMECVEQGECDAAIAVIMQSNVAAKRKAH